MKETDIIDEEVFESDELSESYDEEGTWMEEESEDDRLMRLLAAFGY